MVPHPAIFEKPPDHFWAREMVGGFSKLGQIQDRMELAAGSDGAGSVS